jgi:hypothetical protein
MSSGLRRRARTGTMLCWLLGVCLAAISAATPLLAADRVVDSAVRSLLSDGHPLTPSAPAGSIAAAIDDLSGPAATAIFRLSSPAARHDAARIPPTPRLRTLAYPRALERGPPAGLR